MQVPIQFRFTAVAAVLYVVVSTAALSACSKLPDAPLADEPSVSGDTVRFAAKSLAAQHLRTAPVVSAQEDVLNLPARIVWDEDHTSRIMPPVAGRLTDIAVQAGSPVKIGQALAYFNSPELGSAQTDAARAQADLAQAERNRIRTKELAEAGVVAGKDLELAQADLARTRAEAERTSLRLKSLGGASAVDQHFTLRSPILGIVVERNTNPGMEWRPDQPSAPLFVVSDPTHLWCWIDAPERALGLLHPGMKVILHSSAWPQETYEAQVDYVSDALDPASRTMKVRAKLRNPLRHLKGEMYVTAELISPAHAEQNLLDVPSSAVFLNEGAQQVFVKIAEGQYTRKTIVPVSIGNQWVSIARGLNKGDEVVVDGGLYLQKLLNEGSAQPDLSSAVDVVQQYATAEKTSAQ